MIGKFKPLVLGEIHAAGNTLGYDRRTPREKGPSREAEALNFGIE
jgi:hypothetical protein